MRQISSARRHGARPVTATALVVAALALAGAPAPATATPPPDRGPVTDEGRDFFDVPEAALVRELGAVAENEGGGFPVPFAGTPGLGVPLGGVGAGSFMINQSGTFGPWSFGGQRGTSWEMRALPQAAFHVREQVGQDAATVRTLATDGPVDASGEPVWESPLPAWDTLEPGEGSYAALYPFGTISYEPFATDVSMRFWSPIEAGQDRRTSLPVAYFDVRLANHTDDERTVSTMFTMPNAPAHVDGTNADPGVDLGPVSVREGLSSRYESDGSVHAVTLRSDSEANTPDSRGSEWTIAADIQDGQRFSYTTSWDAEGSGEDVWAPFAASGELPDAPLDGSSSAGAIAVEATLQPGEVTTVPFVLAWDFPQVSFAGGTSVWMRHYTNFYGAAQTATNEYVPGSYAFHQGFEIASDALLDRDAALAAVRRWWEPIASQDAYPAVLRTAALNQLSENVWNNSFWEGGLVTTQTVATGFEALGPGQHVNADVPDSHLFGIQDTIAGGLSGMGDTTSIQAWNQVANFRLFPNLHRDRILAQIESVELSPNGNAHNLYGTLRDPYLAWGNTQDAFIQGGTDSRPPNPGTSQWIDSPSKFVFEWYQYARTTGDTELLERAWPAMQSEIAWLQGTIAEGQHLPTDGPMMSNPFNIVPQGPGRALHNSSLYLLALEVVIASGQELGVDPGYVARLEADLDAARAELEAVFWDEEGQHYRFAENGPWNGAATMVVGAAQRLAESAGLPDVLDLQRHRTELLAHHEDFLTYDADGTLVGASLLWQEGGVADEDGNVPFEVDWVMVGDNFTAAADLVATGRRTGDQRLVDDGLRLGEAVAAQIWTDAGNGLAFAAPWAWLPGDAERYVYPGYSQGLAVWELLDVIAPVAAAAPGEPAASTADVRALLDELRAGDRVRGPLAYLLGHHVDAATRFLARGRTTAAVVELERFLGRLDRTTPASRIDPSAEALLAAAASDVLARLRG